MATIETAIAEIAAGRPVLVADDADRENEVDLIIAGSGLSSQWLGWAVRHGSGVICAPVSDAVADRLDLPPMVRDNQDPKGTAYTVSVDAGSGSTTGISAAERANTIAVLADPRSVATDLIRPGHVFPLRAQPGGVFERRGHTEAAVDLCRLAGLPEVAAIVELVRDDGSMMRLDEAVDLADQESLAVVTIADLVQWRRRYDRVERRAVTSLPTAGGQFTVHGYLDRRTGAEHLALISAGTAPGAVSAGIASSGAPSTGAAPLVRVHSECLTGDVFGSQRCDCGPQLQESMRRVALEGGVVVYLGGHEGRGVGLIDKLRAYALQDGGLDTVDAQSALGLPVDAREFDAAAAILTDLGIESVRLLTNNPKKEAALQELGLTVQREPLEVGRTPSNAGYLHTKAVRLGHVMEAS
ncbi:3,4-dihydroxy-2-butanone-4-phosphate synthase [Rudaeicoccus suwonensis]|uniref:GTP cyclohydrolase-2 n=1 Tax=Rudaeicoccus suwonensis TaxID=657409 RepID=A0A561EA96_9MICO|nr:3,4-dihydroxy-2-butanone-4-phosphate synthase [Rudaeicoccus suwonensis]TWE12545.1 3,4-dihydroxy 2-butanone 4-phosphate synthase/GTP cyclohydrolase II [Rudaeicoccus suwonensis]